MGDQKGVLRKDEWYDIEPVRERIILMSDEKYIPKKGDIVWIDFDPSAGKEIQKRH